MLLRRTHLEREISNERDRNIIKGKKRQLLGAAGWSAEDQADGEGEAPSAGTGR